MISEILDLIFDRYNQIEDEDLRETEEEIKELKYELVDSIVNIFNEIEGLRDLVVAVENEHFEQQLVKWSVDHQEYRSV